MRDDLLRRLAAALTTPLGGAMRALLSETHRRPDLLAALHDTVFQPRGRELLSAPCQAVTRPCRTRRADDLPAAPAEAEGYPADLVISAATLFAKPGWPCCDKRSTRRRSTRHCEPMPWEITDDVEVYAERAWWLLAANPAGNTIALTVIETVRAGRRWSHEAMLFGWYDDGWVSGAVSMTPPYELLLAVVRDHRPAELV